MKNKLLNDIDDINKKIEDYNSSIVKLNRDISEMSK